MNLLFKRVINGHNANLIENNGVIQVLLDGKVIDESSRDTGRNIWGMEGQYLSVIVETYLMDSRSKEEFIKALKEVSW